MYGDNPYLSANTTIAKSTLKKKSNTISFHFVREGSERDEWRTTYINMNLNVSDMMTNTLPEGEHHMISLRMILPHI